MDFRFREINACIFDFDGVLVDSERMVDQIWKNVLKRFAYEVKNGFMDQLFGLSVADIEILYYQEYGNDFPYKEILSIVDKEFNDTIENQGLPQREGVREVIKRSKALGWKIAVASSTNKNELTWRIKKAGLFSFFPVILGGDDVAQSKPEPEIFLLAAKQLGVKPENCLVLEDSENGIVAAKRAGMKVVLVVDRAPITEKSKELSDLIVYSHNELLELFGK